MRLELYFLVGGTPSLAPVEVIAGILQYIKSTYKLKLDAEITLEANPSSVDIQNCALLKQAGVNRVSIGIQSFEDNALKFLGRAHDANDALNAVASVSKIFENYSIDLIYSLPWHSAESWQKELLHALKYVKNHVSLYQLTIEKGTQFFKQYKNGDFILPQDDKLAQLFERTRELTGQFGLELYEVSNYAKQGFECMHNLAYWEYKQYVGIGPGAHSRFLKDDNVIAVTNFYDPYKWHTSVLQNEKKMQEITLTTEDVFNEKVLMGLRTKRGLNINIFNASHIQKLGFIDMNETSVTTTNKGILLLDSIIQFILQ
ncbi:Oxygen-independent coproporphyrinogen-III oxidase C-terminal domain protein [Candidatus Cyrtobacter comes]|uniref:Heme chaperone HemW n=1 Tax=Candidatus Cyrtobacter comes TaxID=675776 RepID=A0ABU5L7R8_9RICK|nr:radical SAM family heme chaperone HemW [Candidatus Cyrtobacter comes]MDZ5761859.1 Oxygen-independent coproporphyrinogen-III oxidase C-terminal domain protein [Candidatus Cyrtobacter comes]